jgi:uncharacterized protein YkwD
MSQSAVALALGLLLGLPAAWCRADPKGAAKFQPTKEEQALVDLTNQARARQKLSPLKANAVLAAVARAHSANMARKGELSHDLDGKAPKDRVQAAGYDYAAVGENVAFAENGDPKEIFEGWMSSAGHRTNILREQYQEIGVGVASNAKGETYYTQVFARPKRKR